jgi:hypothetical protein
MVGAQVRARTPQSAAFACGELADKGLSAPWSSVSAFGKNQRAVGMKNPVAQISDGIASRLLI